MEKIRHIDFDTILPIWRDQLWPGRVSPIMPVSPMKYLGGYDTKIYNKYTDLAVYFGMYDDETNDLIGVFSGHPTSPDRFRARGLFVMPLYRGIGLGRQLVKAVISEAKSYGADFIWCLPRVNNVKFFEQCGFAPVSNSFNDERVEFGPNLYMAQPLMPF
jgi:GNAT superfamily N-acetyltransferase